MTRTGVRKRVAVALTPSGVAAYPFLSDPASTWHISDPGTADANVAITRAHPLSQRPNLLTLHTVQGCCR